MSSAVVLDAVETTVNAPHAAGCTFPGAAPGPPLGPAGGLVPGPAEFDGGAPLGPLGGGLPDGGALPGGGDPGG
ncbi:hypothetical protein ACFWUP_12750 [Nocardia sp. NPDC058658]|uniref:hypothetical protein n=1 Tax=Nocardia sp. NPDC058658 TaxID=3346580 RepID=UPI0036540B13